MTELPAYWVYQTTVIYRRRQMVQARLITPPSHERAPGECGYGFRAPDQAAPYGVDLRLTYRVNNRHPRPDNYVDNFGFSLFSDRLVALLARFDVAFEAFPVRCVDEAGNALPDLRYSVFHLLGEAVDAMDHEASGWQGDTLIGIPRLVLAPGGFERRPLMLLKHVYARLMRADVRDELEREGITGFSFLNPARYCSGSFGPPPPFQD